jgi:hypothetical protein
VKQLLHHRLPKKQTPSRLFDILAKRWMQITGK